MHNLINLITYLKEKKVPFGIEVNKDGNMIPKYPALFIEKRGKFYYANGVRVAKNMISQYLA